MWKVSPRTTLLFLAVLATLGAPFFGSLSVSAAQLTNRYISVGNSVPSATTNHRFAFDIATVGMIGSIKFDYCSNSPLVTDNCTAPSGLDLSGVTLSAQTGETGFSIDPASTSNSILLTRPSVVNAAIPASYTFNSAINHSTPNSPVFVRITTYPTIDGTGAWNDDGSVAFSTSSIFIVAGFVPPYLTFCVGVTVSGDCSSANGQNLNFGELRTDQTGAVTSQFAGATNDPGGYSTFVNGLTMTSGTNTIPALTSPTASQLGVSQFGMNLRANSMPSVGSNPSGVGTAVANSNFNQLNKYIFKNQVITSSTKSTDFNRFTASYIVNVSTAQPAGIYNTTLTYIATAAF